MKDSNFESFMGALVDDRRAECDHAFITVSSNPGEDRRKIGEGECPVCRREKETRKRKGRKK